MAKKIDYEALYNIVAKCAKDHLKEDVVPIPTDTVIDICFSLARLHRIELDLQGKFQEI